MKLLEFKFYAVDLSDARLITPRLLNLNELIIKKIQSYSSLRNDFYCSGLLIRWHWKKLHNNISILNFQINFVFNFKSLKFKKVSQFQVTVNVLTEIDV